MDANQENEIRFEEFLAARLREKGITLKRLGEITGISPSHLENLFRGNFEDMPSTPYFRGYIMRIAKILDFDGEEWWARFRKESFMKNSGPSDALPRNRFIKKEIPKLLWPLGIAGVLILAYLITVFPRVTGKPILTIIYPGENPFVTASSTLTIQGTIRNADAVYLSSSNGSSSEEIPVAPDGSWQKTVLLQDGLNPFEITAKKILGGDAIITEQIVYQALTASSSTTSSAAFPTIHYATNTPATGTYFD